MGLDHERALNQVAGFGLLTNAERMEQRTRNRDAGHGWVTDVQLLQLEPAVPLSTTSTAEPMTIVASVDAAGGDDASSSDDDTALSGDGIMLSVVIVLAILVIAGLASNYNATLLRLKKQSNAPITDNPGFVHPTQGLVIHKTPGMRPALYCLPSTPFGQDSLRV